MIEINTRTLLWVGSLRDTPPRGFRLYDLILCVNDFEMKTMSSFSQTLLRLSGWDLIFKLNSKKEKINTRTLLWVGSLRDTPPRGLKTNQSF